MPPRSSKELNDLFAKRRHVYFIPLDGHIEGRGWRPSIVFEGEPDHYPSGDWPYTGEPGQKAPWFWGPTYEDAVRQADEMNDKMGISKLLAVEIISSSMAVSKEPRGRRARA